MKSQEEQEQMSQKHKNQKPEKWKKGTESDMKQGTKMVPQGNDRGYLPEQKEAMNKNRNLVQ